MGLDKTAVMLAAAMEDDGESPWGVLARHHKRLAAREMAVLAELDHATGMGCSESRAPRRL